MSERPFFIHWNELSFGSEIDESAPISTVVLGQRVSQAFEALQAVLKIRSDCRLLVQRGTLSSLIMGKPYGNWIEEFLGKDGFRKLRSKISQPEDDTEALAVHELDCELSCGSLRGEGLTRAHLASSWVWSFGSVEAQCAGTVVSAEKMLIASPEVIVVEVPNLAVVDHSVHWNAQLENWGRTVAASSIIAIVEGYQFIMYPSDHWPPHLHVHMSSIPWLNAKYRIDKFEVLNAEKIRPSGLDNIAKVWIERNIANLTMSWERCKRGDMPLRIL